MSKRASGRHGDLVPDLPEFDGLGADILKTSDMLAIAVAGALMVGVSVLIGGLIALAILLAAGDGGNGVQWLSTGLKWTASVVLILFAGLIVLVCVAD